MIRKKCLSISIDFEDAHNLEKIANHYGQKISYIVGSEIKKFVKEAERVGVLKMIDEKFGAVLPRHRENVAKNTEPSTIE